MQRKNTIAGFERNEIWCKVTFGTFYLHSRSGAEVFCNKSNVNIQCRRKTLVRIAISRLRAFPLRYLTQCPEGSVVFPLRLFPARKSLFFCNPTHMTGLATLESLPRHGYFRWGLSCLARVPTKRKFVRSRSLRISLCASGNDILPFCSFSLRRPEIDRSVSDMIL